MVYKRRFRRFNRRRTVKRRYRKTRRFSRRKSIISKTKRFIKYGVRKIKRSPRQNFILSWDAGAQTKRFQQSFIVEIPKSSFNTNNGHFPVDFAVNSLMTSQELQALQKDFYMWRLSGFTCGIKFLTGRNLYRFTNNGSTLANHFWQALNTEEAQIFGGFFRFPQQQDDCVAIDPDTSATFFSSILETNCYKRLRMNGSPIYWKWYNATAYKGEYTQFSSATITTPLSTAFNGSLPAINQPHGIDIMLTDRDRIPNTTTTEEPKIKVQIVTYCVINLRCKKPVDY